jgi:hypothetical protein
MAASLFLSKGILFDHGEAVISQSNIYLFDFNNDIEWHS